MKTKLNLSIAFIFSVKIFRSRARWRAVWRPWIFLSYIHDFSDKLYTASTWNYAFVFGKDSKSKLNRPGSTQPGVQRPNSKKILFLSRQRWKHILVFKYCQLMHNTALIFQVLTTLFFKEEKLIFPKLWAEFHKKTAFFSITFTIYT